LSFVLLLLLLTNFLLSFVCCREEDEQEEEEEGEGETGPLPMLNADPSVLQILKDAGFEEEKCRRALILSRNNPEIAMELLLSNAPSLDTSQPLELGPQV
jgi:uncharacterized UBP type Zn finger protein